MVDIVIPIYKASPTSDEKISLNRLFSTLGDRRTWFVMPRGLDTSAYAEFPAGFVDFDRECFQNISSFNRLMLSEEFYLAFESKFILIHHTDAFILGGNLDEWTEKDYDYVGSPWIRSSDQLPTAKLILDRGLAISKALMNFRGNGKTQKDKSLLYNAVGNGGLSLRKRDRFLDILSRLGQVAAVYRRNEEEFFNEDVFWSVEPKRNGIDLRVPGFREACRFSLENKPARGLMFTGGDLPFGCHAWHKEREFWLPHFRRLGVSI